MKAFPSIPKKKREIGFQTKISVMHRFRCFTICQPRPFYHGIIVVSHMPDSFGKESGNFSRVSVCRKNAI